MAQDGKVSILIVDDRADKLLALEAVLDDLNQNIVRAYSGREALRQVLSQEFAVILLDVNMPGMDGFETAALIRQRKTSEHVPIIFITAMNDEMYAARGYSLGAVDYIMAPVVPGVLRSKVAVFVDLFKKTEQVRRQADRLRQRAAQLHRLTAASLIINSTLSIERMLRVVTETACDLVGASECSTCVRIGGGRPRIHIARSGNKAPADAGNHRPDPEASPAEPVAFSPLQLLVCEANKPMRMTRAELESHSHWSAAEAGGWLAAPLTGRDGANLGLVELFGPSDADFGEDDEAMLVQLAQMSSIALENSLFAEEREANRLKDEFLATVSHELRTPLNAILGWTQLLQMETAGPADFAHGLEVIERNVKAQTKLIEDLLDVSRISTGKLRLNISDVSLDAVVGAAVDAVLPSAEAKQVSVRVSLDCGGRVVRGDASRLEQVAWNLLSNAIKFTPAGGMITVETRLDTERVSLRVIDTGQGIDAKFLPHVFERFRQADSTSTRVHSGLGIGLTIVQRIVDLHHGSVQAESEGAGRGAAFTVTLPLALQADGAADSSFEPQGSSAVVEAAGAAANQEQGNAPYPAGDDLSDLQILVVDDEPDAREVLSEILRRFNARVSVAGSAREALDLVGLTPPDVIICDIAMPDIDGYELARTLRQLPEQEGGGTPAIALTAFARGEDRARALSAGFQMHLCKPVEPVHLVAAVQRVARQRTSSRPVTAGR